jgi:hypothetical protein
MALAGCEDHELGSARERFRSICQWYRADRTEVSLTLSAAA